MSPSLHIRVSGCVSVLKVVQDKKQDRNMQVLFHASSMSLELFTCKMSVPKSKFGLKSCLLECTQKSK